MNYQQFRPSGFKLLPPVVKNLLIINGLMFLGTYVIGYTFRFDLVDYFGLYHWDSQYFKPYQFITHLFMHGGFAHVLLNMFALWMFGYALENVWGGKRFLIFYLVTGLGAAFIHLLVTSYQLFSVEQAARIYINSPSVEAFANFAKEHVPAIYMNSFQQLINPWMYDPNNSSYLENSMLLIEQLIEIKRDIPTVGASGAVFGVLLAFGMLFPNTIIYIYLAIPMKAKYLVILYGAIELYTGIQNDPADNVAHFAHLGGMLFGFLLIKFWNRNTKNFY